VASNPIKDAYKNEPLQRRNSTAKLRKISLSLCKNTKKLHTVYLKASCGYSNPIIGKILSIHYNTVGRYIKTYREKGMEGLYSNPYQGKGSQLEVCKASIIEDFNKNPVCSIAQAAARIKALTGIERKPTQVRAFMRRHGFKYRKLAAVPGKLNPEKQKQFLEETLEPAIEKAQKGEVELLFCDAAHFTLSVMEKAGELGITLLFLPPYSPNLNIIERLWKFTNSSFPPNKKIEQMRVLRFATSVIRCFIANLKNHN
jgi:transposase